MDTEYFNNIINRKVLLVKNEIYTLKRENKPYFEIFVEKWQTRSFCQATKENLNKIKKQKLCRSVIWPKCN